MRFEGTINIDAPVAQVWQFLDNPPVIAQCIPGLRELRPIRPNKEYRLVVAADLGALKPTFELELIQTTAANRHESRLRIRGRGYGSHVGAAGHVSLNDRGDGTTEMHWSLVLATCGELARLGSELTMSLVNKASEKFVEHLCERIDDTLEESVPSLLRAM